MKYLTYLHTVVQYCLPHHLLSRMMHRLMRGRINWLNQAFIRWLIKTYGVDMNSFQVSDPRQYVTINEFFTRRIKLQLRPIDSADTAIISPVDGVISQMGKIVAGDLIQAKGKYYDVTTLLGGDRDLGAVFDHGNFTTLYLSPRDYHRIHMPMAGIVKKIIYVPGKLFSVNNATTQAVPALFNRNERVVVVFDTLIGPMAMVLVGAIFVGSIETVWLGEVTPPHRSEIETWMAECLTRAPTDAAKGVEMGRFNMGSTVILVFAKQDLQWVESFQTGDTVNMGQTIANITLSQ